MIEGADSSMLYNTKSTGILNAYLRLKMYSNSDILFDIDSKPDSGTDILIGLPFNKRDK